VVLACFALAFTVVSPAALAQRKKPARSSSNSNRSDSIKPSSSSPKTGRKAASVGSAKTSPSNVSARSLTIQTEPKAAVWLDELRRGRTDDAGRLVIEKVKAGRHSLRVRAAGFRERTVPVLPNERGLIQVGLTRTTDEAELLFQQAEDAREGLPSADGTRRDAVELYRRALELRPRFPAARVGLARSLLALDDYDGALEQIEAARRVRPVYPEASAVEGRILRAAADPGAAVESYRRAIREARGVQPEAYAGLGIVLEEKGSYDEAVEAFRKAIAQLDDTEPALYQLLGAAYEKLENWREAVRAYDKYLALAPEGKLAPAIRSIIDQLRTQAAEQEQQQSSPDN
jgi:hypothetical protein